MKIVDCLYDNSRMELMRKTEEKFECGQLNLTQLQSVLIDVAKIDEQRYSAEVLQSLDGKDRGGSTGNEQDQKQRSETRERQPKRGGTLARCFYCKKRGHMIKDCWAKQAADRESETDGRQEQSAANHSSSRRNEA